MGIQLVIARGPRAAEEALLAELGQALAAGRDEPALWSRPVRVVVPSRSLRLHLGRRVVRRFGATCGLAIQTLSALALEIAGRARTLPSDGASMDRATGDRALVDGELAFELLARRAARAEPELARELGRRRDGLRPALAVLRDLADAGFLPAHADALLERLTAQAGDGHADARARARALVRAAARVEGELEGLGRASRARVLRLAASTLERDGERALPARSILVHGFADATGVASDLLVALPRAAPTLVLLDVPADPAAPAESRVPDPSSTAFVARLRGRLAGGAGGAGGAREVGAEGALSATEHSFFRAPGAEPEAREVARRIRALLDGGVEPEEIGIVARDLGPHRAALRAELTRHGVPFSGLGASGAGDATTRRLVALAELLREGAELPAERWLDALLRFPVEEAAPEPGSEPASAPLERRSALRRPSFDLRLALRSVGAARLADVAALDPALGLDERDTLALPARSGIAVREDPIEEDAPARRTVAVRRRLDGATWRGALQAARRMVAALARRADDERWEAQLEALEALVHEELGVRAGDALDERLAPALALLRGALPNGERASPAEVALLLERALEPEAAPPLGGAGGGVALLGALEARGRTFEHLFVIGVNRERFPRVAAPDALFPDDLRRAAADCLPDLPIKARSHDEERHLFAQLAGAAPRVTISWHSAGDAGEARAPSLLIERWLGRRADSVPRAVGAFQEDARQGSREDGAPRPAVEHAVLAGLLGGPRALEPALAVALDPEGEPRRALAAARAAILAAYDRGPALELGPWLGCVGPAEESAIDPLLEPPFVTRLERLVVCPWQLFLTRILGLEPAPDPLEALPSLSPLRVGSTVHEALEAVAERSLGERPGELAAALERAPLPLAWPADEELERILRAAAEKVLRKELQPLPGLIQALAAVARPYVDAARAALDRRPSDGFLGVELRGQVVLPRAEGAPWRIGFRADAVERDGGTLILTDYKTGKPPFEAKKSETRHDKLLAWLAAGQGLQAAAYAAGAAPHQATGRFLYLSPEGPLDSFELAVDSADAPALAAFRESAGTALRAWRQGTFFPRLLDPHKHDRENPACQFCEVAAACVRGDSGIRRRVSAFGAAARAGELDGEAAALWRLASGVAEEEA